jgi:hypothetical protein
MERFHALRRLRLVGRAGIGLGLVAAVIAVPLFVFGPNERATRVAVVPPTTPGAAPVPAHTAQGQARQIIDAVIVPAAARRVSSIPGFRFSEPAEYPVCNPLVDETRFWLVPGDLHGVYLWMKSHPPSWMAYGHEGSGIDHGQITSYSLAESPSGTGWGSLGMSRPGVSRFQDELVFGMAEASSGMIGIRADAVVVPPGASCVSNGGSGLGHATP